MITYQVYSNKAECDIQIKYGENGRLLGIEFLISEMIICEEDRRAIFYNAPSTIGVLKQLAIKNKWILTEIKPDLNFDTFWKKYGNTGGSKVTAKKLWEKLSEKNKNLAMEYINKYKQSLGSTTQAYATTYLNQQYWIK
jgi:hypothetical protein